MLKCYNLAPDGFVIWVTYRSYFSNKISVVRHVTLILRLVSTSIFYLAQNVLPAKIYNLQTLKAVKLDEQLHPHH